MSAKIERPVGDPPHVCAVCKGSGRVEKDFYHYSPITGGEGGYDAPSLVDCEACGGTGVPDGACWKCSGRGWTQMFDDRQMDCSDCDGTGWADRIEDEDDGCPF